jgi:hypothetical protein
MCWGVTAVKDNIYIGGNDKVLILNTDGSRVREITTDGYNYNLLYSNTIRWTGKRYFIFIGFIILVYIYLFMRWLTIAK